MLVVSRRDVRFPRVIALGEHLEYTIERSLPLGTPDEMRYELHFAVLG
jgi:hypothetical protein